jgi:hypothetical protein
MGLFTMKVTEPGDSGNSGHFPGGSASILRFGEDPSQDQARMILFFFPFVEDVVIWSHRCITGIGRSSNIGVPAALGLLAARYVGNRPNPLCWNDPFPFQQGIEAIGCKVLDRLNFPDGKFASITST